MFKIIYLDNISWMKFQIFSILFSCTITLLALHGVNLWILYQSDTSEISVWIFNRYIILMLRALRICDLFFLLQYTFFLMYCIVYVLYCIVYVKTKYICALRKFMDNTRIIFVTRNSTVVRRCTCLYLYKYSSFIYIYLVSIDISLNYY